VSVVRCDESLLERMCYGFDGLGCEKMGMGLELRKERNDADLGWK